MNKNSSIGAFIDRASGTAGTADGDCSNEMTQYYFLLPHGNPSQFSSQDASVRESQIFSGDSLNEIKAKPLFNLHVLFFVAFLFLFRAGSNS